MVSAHTVSRTKHFIFSLQIKKKSE